MADGVHIKKRFETLSKGAYFEVLLPRSSDFDAIALLKDGSPEELAKAPTRRNLFFGTCWYYLCWMLRLTETQVYR